MNDLDELYKKLIEGQLRALARLISLVENRAAGTPELIQKVIAHTGQAFVIGVTGSPGAGKSSLVDCLIHRFRNFKKTVGVVAIDPSSPISGGALLGDRIRMQSHTLDRGVFIRSIANRGGIGGLARSTRDIIKLIDAYQRDIIIVETTGVGQSEVEIMNLVDIVVLVLSPETGDDIQANKAGIMEIGDIFVVNKSDLNGSARLKTFIQSSINLSQEKSPVLMTNTVVPAGINLLCETILEQIETRKKTGEFYERREQQLSREIVQELKELAISRIQKIERTSQFEQVFEKVKDSELSLKEAVNELFPLLVNINNRT